MEEINKYVCDNCKYDTNNKLCWQAHLKTVLHKTGHRKKRSDFKQPSKCEKCDYTTKSSINLKKHFLNNHCEKEQREKEYTFYCRECDFGVFYENFMNDHKNTVKHKYNMTLVQKIQ